MDEENKLLLQEQILLQELEIIKLKLRFIHLSKDESQKATTVPSLEIKKTEANPEQPATGKDISNPEMVMNLPKVQKGVQTPTTLVKPSDFNLRPNGNMGIQIPSTSKDAAEQSVKEIQTPKNFKPYYVVFNGPNPGIYESWNIAELAVKGVTGIKHKKFKSFLEARVAAEKYSRETTAAPIELIPSALGLKPNSFAQAVKNGKSTKINLGKIPVKPQLYEEENGKKPLSFNDFKYNYQIARHHDEEDGLEDQFFTTDGNNLSYYNFLPNANPEQVYEAFECGLVKKIVTSPNLLEISKFPKSFRKAVKNFRTKVGSSDSRTFLQVQSSLPWWNHEGVYFPAISIVKIGIYKQQDNYKPSKNQISKLEDHEYQALVVQKLEPFIKKAFEFEDESQIIVNYCDSRCIIFSKTYRPISEQDKERILSFQKKITSGQLLGDHYKDICKVVKKAKLMVGQGFTCAQCEKDESIKVAAMMDHKNASGKEDSPTASTSSN